MPNNKLKELVNLIRSSKPDTPYTILLGSGLSMTPALLEALGCQDWDAFDALMQSKSANERYSLLHQPLTNLDQQTGYRCLVQLLKAGYFNILLTANFDSNLDQAIQAIGLIDDEIDLLVVGEHRNEHIVNALSRPQSRIKICMLRGRLSRRTIPNASQTIEFDPQLARMLETYLAQDVIILGSTGRDIDILRTIPPRGGSLWHVAPESTSSDFWIKALQQSRSGEVVTCEEAHFNRFFCTLSDGLGLQQGYADSLQKTHAEETTPSANQQGALMNGPSFSSDEAEIKREIDHVQKLIHTNQRNLGILEQLIARQGVANVDLYFRKADLEEELAQLHNRLRDVETRQRELSIDQSLLVSVDVLYTYLPSGVLTLYNDQTMPLLKYKIFNNTDQPIELVLQSEIEDFSNSANKQVKVSPKAEEPFYQLPTVKADKMKAVTEITKAVVHTHVKVLSKGAENPDRFNKDFEVYLMARNVIRWAVQDVAKGSGYIPLLEHIAAWVTPHNESVIKTLRDAADYPPYNFDGYLKTPDPGFVREQIKAIYQVLQEKVQLAYINSPFAVGPSNGEERQTVRLPSETLRERSANCIDGAVLYASLIELAFLEPIILFQKDHAFVGWKTAAGADSYEFIDTTVTRTAPFEDALDRGMEKYQQLVREGWFYREVFDPTGFACLLDIKALHDKGIYPME